MKNNFYKLGAAALTAAMLLAGCVLMAIAFFWLPRLQHSQPPAHPAHPAHPTKETTP